MSQFITALEPDQRHVNARTAPQLLGRRTVRRSLTRPAGLITVACLAVTLLGTPAPSNGAPSTLAANTQMNFVRSAMSGSDHHGLVGSRHSLFDRAHHERRGPAPSVDIAIGDAPFGIVVDRRTGSVYVADATGVALFDGAACNARNSTGCNRTPIAVTAGTDNIGLALDESTDTLYVADGPNGTVSVVDISTCNIHDTSGCAATRPVIPVGTFAAYLAIAQDVHTLYATNSDFDPSNDTVSMIDTATCNGHVTSGCQATPPTATTGLGQDGLVVDARTHTLYVSNGLDDTISVIDTSACNATHPSGCSTHPPAVPLTGSPSGGALDPVSSTLVIPMFSDLGDIAGAVSMIDAAHCNATNLTACATTPVTALAGTGAGNVAINPVTRRAYVVNGGDSDVSVIDLTRCNATRSDGCRRGFPTMTIGFGGGGVAVDVSTDTIYASGQDEGVVTVLDGRACNSSNTSGCRHPAPTTDVGIGAAGSAVDHHTNTLYVPNQIAGTVSVIDPSVCNVHNRSGCDTAWPTVQAGDVPKAVVVDETFDTLYAANYNGSTVSVIDTRACNAHVSTGCGQTALSIAVIGGAYTLDIDPVTHTVYVANVDIDTITVINTKTCNAHITSGCGQTPLAVHIGNLPAAVYVDQGSRTVYVSIRGDQTVTAIDADTCNATITSGCGGTHPTVTISAPPRFLTADDRTHTLFVSTRNNSTVAMIDTSTCNGRASNGCTVNPPVVNVGYLPYGIAADASSGQVFVGNVGDSTVTAFNSRTCNAHNTNGCSAPMRTIETGGWPTSLTVDDRNGTLYVSDNVDAQVSIINLRGDH